MIFNRQRGAQPQGPAVLELAHPLLRGVASVFHAPAVTQDLNLGGPLALFSGTAGIVTSPQGVSLNAVAQAYRTPTTVALDCTKPFTVFVLGVCGTVTGDHWAFCGTAGNLALFGTRAATLAFSDTVVTTQYGTIAIGEPYSQMLRFDGVNLAGFKNGTKLVSQTTNLPTSTGRINWAATDTGASAYAASQLTLAVAWRRALTDQEALLMHINPWRVFTPWRLVLAVGGSVAASARIGVIPFRRHMRR